MNTRLMATYPPQPVTFVRGAGSRLWDDAGREYLDFLCGLAVTSLGHAHPAVAEALCGQAQTLLHVSNLFGTEPQRQVAATLDRLVDSGSGQVFFCNSGAEANEAALKLARKWGGPGRYVVVSAYGSFHGRTLATLHATGQPSKHEPFQPLPEGFRHVAWRDTVALANAVDPTVAAVLLEAVQGEGGVNPAGAEYFRQVRDLCDERGVLMMVDEVQTGLGRTGEWFGFPHYGVRPDVVTMAKALGNGVPIGACWARDDVANAFVPGDHATTFGGQPLATAAAAAVLAVMEAENVPERARRAGAYLTTALERLPEVKAVRGLGLLLAVELKDGLAAGGVASACLDAGLVVNAVTSTALRLAPSLLVTQDEMDEAVAILGRALATVGATMRHFLEVDDLDPAELNRVLDLAEVPRPEPVLAGRGVALIFEKPSNRTRNSTEMAVVGLGGHPIAIRGEEIGLGVRETVEDVTRVLARYHRVVGARVFDHGVLEEMARVDEVPVVNLLSDVAHPCQALADLLTMRQRWGSLKGRKVAWIGDGNNVARSLTVACGLAGMDVALACPAGHQVDPVALDSARSHGVEVTVTDDPAGAAAGADAVCTDVWVSMGQEAEAIERADAFARYRVDEELMALAAPGALFLHCLPAHRGLEVSAEVIDGPASAVWDQAENRMHEVWTAPMAHQRSGGIMKISKNQRQHRVAQILEQHSVTSQLPPTY